MAERTQQRIPQVNPVGPEIHALEVSTVENVPLQNPVQNWFDVITRVASGKGGYVLALCRYGKPTNRLAIHNAQLYVADTVEELASIFGAQRSLFPSEVQQVRGALDGMIPATEEDKVRIPRATSGGISGYKTPTHVGFYCTVVCLHNGLYLDPRSGISNRNSIDDNGQEFSYLPEPPLELLNKIANVAIAEHEVEPYPDLATGMVAEYIRVTGYKNKGRRRGKQPKFPNAKSEGSAQPSSAVPA